MTIQELLAEWNCPDDLAFQAATLFDERLDELERRLAAMEKPEATPVYDENFGDDRVCECGHTYYRHFDSYDDMEPVGCKYCECRTFKEAAADDAAKIGYYSDHVPNWTANLDKWPAMAELLKPDDLWSVSVTRNGETILTIEHNCLSGKTELSKEDNQTIRNAARHLLAFIGESELAASEPPASPAIEAVKPQPPAASGLTALAAKWREAADDVHCGTLAERKVLRRCADEMEAALQREPSEEEIAKAAYNANVGNGVHDNFNAGVRWALTWLRQSS